MAEISNFKKIEDVEFERLFEYYGIIQANIDKAKKEGIHSTLLQPHNLTVMEANCPQDMQGYKRPTDCGKAFKEFIAVGEAAGCQLHDTLCWGAPL